MNYISHKLHTIVYPFYERLWIEKYRKLHEGDIYVDVGAYLGEFLPYASKKVGETGKVIAVEADPDNIPTLKDAISNIKTNKILLVESAVSDIKDVISFVSNNQYSSSFIETPGTERKVTATTLDNIAEDLSIDHINLLKLNIEGAEESAIKGSSKILNKTEHVVISSHLVNGKHTYIAIKPLLESIGFMVKVEHRLFGSRVHMDLYGFNTYW